MKHPASSRLTSYAVVVRVNGSHLIKNYLITFLALISGAWLSLARTPRLPSHRCHHLLPLSLSLSFFLSRALGPPIPRPPSTLSRLPRPLAASSISSYTLLLHSVHNQPAAKSLSWFAFFFSFPPLGTRLRLPAPAFPPANNPTPSALSFFFHFSVFLSLSLSLSPFTLFFLCSPEVRLATSYPKRRKLPVNVISLLIRFSSRFSRTANPPPPIPAPRDPASAGITPLLPGTRLRSHL